MRLGTKLAIGLIVGFAAVGGAGILFGSSAFSEQQALSDPDSGGTTEAPTSTATATQTRTASATPTATATEAPTSTPEDERSDDRRASVALNESDIADHIAAYINERRESPLSTEATSSEDLAVMARNHSANMAEAGFVTHDVGYGDSKARYERAGLFSRCQFESERYVGVIDAGNNLLESIGRTDAGAYSEATVNETERDVARAIVDSWFGSSTYRERLTWKNADFLGVGVTVTEDDEVYATANVC